MTGALDISVPTSDTWPPLIVDHRRGIIHHAAATRTSDAEGATVTDAHIDVAAMMIAGAAKRRAAAPASDVATDEDLDRFTSKLYRDCYGGPPTPGIDEPGIGTACRLGHPQDDELFRLDLDGEGCGVTVGRLSNPVVVRSDDGHRQLLVDIELLPRTRRPDWMRTRSHLLLVADQFPESIGMSVAGMAEMPVIVAIDFVEYPRVNRCGLLGDERRRGWRPAIGGAFDALRWWRAFTRTTGARSPSTGGGQGTPQESECVGAPRGRVRTRRRCKKQKSGPLGEVQS